MQRTQALATAIPHSTSQPFCSLFIHYKTRIDQVGSVHLCTLCNNYVLFLAPFCSPPANSTRPFVAYAPNVQWLRIPLYLFGTIHLVLAIWMVAEYFLINLPHFKEITYM